MEPKDDSDLEDSDLEMKADMDSDSYVDAYSGVNRTWLMEE